MPVTRSRRLQGVDALRGFALLGIVLVNVQSFTWGPGNPLGYFDGVPDAADKAVFALLACFVAGKFYAIFAFLFGFGFSQQIRKMRRLAGGHRAAATRMYLRRLAFLLAVGIAHGVLLYFGDILATYAICALALLPFGRTRLRALTRAIRVAWIVSAALVAFWTTVSFATAEPGDTAIPPDIVAAHAVYTDGDYAEQLARRASDDFSQTLGGATLNWVQVIGLMLTGTLAGRLGWLRHPRRHPRVARAAMGLGLGIGLPCAAVGAYLHLQTMRAAPGTSFGLDQACLAGSVLLSFAYIASAILWFQEPRRAAPLASALVRWLGPAGRMPLTLYVTQSFAMGLLLSGWGLGLAARASRPQLALLALAIYAAQVLAARTVEAWGLGGPLEALWRRVTYRRAA